MQTEFRTEDWQGGDHLREFAEYLTNLSGFVDESPAICDDISDVARKYGIGYLEALAITFGRTKISAARKSVDQKVEKMLTDDMIKEIMTKSPEKACEVLQSLVEKSTPREAGITVIVRVYAKPRGGGGIEFWAVKADNASIFPKQSEYDEKKIRKTVIEFVTDVSLSTDRELKRYSK